MKAIFTKYHGPSNVRGSRVSASDDDRNRVIIGYDSALNSDENHREAAQALCRKLGWKGTMIGGSVKGGMAWVWEKGSPAFYAWSGKAEVSK